MQRTVGNSTTADLIRGQPASPALQLGIPFVVQRKLTVDGEVTSRDHIDDLYNSSASDFTGLDTSQVKLAIQELVDDEHFANTLTRAEFAHAVSVAYQAFFLGGPPPTETYAKRLALRLSQSKIGARFFPRGRGSVYARVSAVLNEGPSIALGSFLHMHPEVAKSLAGTSINPNSMQAKGLGGLYKDNTVHVEPDVQGESPDVFMRVLLHEIGHATFQKALFATQGGALGDDANKAAPMPQALPTPGLLDPVAAELDRRTAPLTTAGKELYNAWLVLRSDSARWIFGANLGTGRGAQQRLTYQAETFTEFCAESFMHLFAEERGLRDHARLISEDASSPSEVVNAWTTVLRILNQYRDDIRATVASGI